MVQFGAELFEGCFSTLVNEFIDKPLRIYENDLSRLRSKPTMIFMIFEVLHLESYIKMLECNMTSKCAAL